MATPPPTIPAAEAVLLQTLITPTDGTASRVLAKASGGSLTLFAFAAGGGLAEHTTPFDALVLPLEGSLTLVIGGVRVAAAPGTIVRLPARVPHAVEAPGGGRMLLVLLRDQ